MAIATPINEDLLDPAVLKDPWSYFGWLRENDPIHWNPIFNMWIVTRYEDASVIMRKHDVFSNAVPFMENPNEVDVFPPVNKEDWHLWDEVQEYRTFLFQDRPEHTAPRQAVHRWFTPRGIERWRAELASTAQELIDAFRGDGEVELIEAFANKFPLLTISWMLGIPLEDAPRLNDLGVNVITAVDPGRLRHAWRSAREFAEYFNPLLDARAREPQEDIVSMLATAEQEGSITRQQSLNSLVLMFQAGHNTTLALISTGMLAFIANPDAWDRLRSDPEGLAPGAVEECLRFSPPIVTIPTRLMAHDYDFHGIEIHRGDAIGFSIAAANRDPRQFPDPDKFDITRSPNKHIAFGGGIHHCLGNQLARVEGQEAFKALARNFERMRVTREVEWTPHLAIHEPAALHLAWA